MKYLTDSGYSAHLEKESDTVPYPEIWINLFDDTIVKVHVKSEVIPVETRLVQGKEMHFIHFFVAFDKVIEENLHLDAAGLCAILNKVTPLGAFGFSNPDKLFTFSYMYPLSEIDHSALDVIFSLIHYSTNLFLPTLLEFNGLNKLIS